MNASSHVRWWMRRSTPAGSPSRAGPDTRDYGGSDSDWRIRSFSRPSCAPCFAPLRILFPFVSSAQEIRAARALLAEARAELHSRGAACGNPTVGIMIEVPSAAFTASLLAREADFFTIGTNDLIQYTLAVDRTDERVSDRYQPLHPAVLRLLRQVRRGAIREGIPVAICGEMASDPLLLRLLIGCGITEFSMTPGALPMARRVAQDTHAGDMARIAARVLTLGTVEEIEQSLLDAFGRAGIPTTVTTE
jgi:phosphoenolpyruvate-protein phosphotransferase (PTS system enzyme I)